MKKIKRKMESMQTKQMQTVFELKNFSNEVKGNMIKIKPDYLEQIVQNKVIADILKMTAAKNSPKASPKQ